MINSISGKLTFKSPEAVGIDTGGVEWALEVTASTLAALPAIGSQVRIFTHLHHTQDSMRLYGFAALAERRLFHALLTVGGVGPSLARKILSGTTPERFSAAMETEDVDALASIPGLGKKTAQKIILQLRGKLAGNEADAPDSGGKEVAAALISMGFDSRGAARAVAEILQEEDIVRLSGQEQEREILRRAIIHLSS
ncbi:MAG: Holliday junction branch migration protein RuvA [Spirochaeta sp. LUC14_002_19_P3]|nr:MAG: Holliday junction branch migration protein RuvA [Spirochaeta sp. LUC14_002_19_P3]